MDIQTCFVAFLGSYLGGGDDSSLNFRTDVEPLYLLIILFLVIVAIRTFALYAGFKLTKMEGKMVHLFLASLFSSFLGFLPYFGFFISLIAFYVFIILWTSAGDESWDAPIEAIIVIMLSWGLSHFIGIFILNLAAA